MYAVISWICFILFLLCFILFLLFLVFAALDSYSFAGIAFLGCILSSLVFIFFEGIARIAEVKVVKEFFSIVLSYARNIGKTKRANDKELSDDEDFKINLMSSGTGKRIGDINNILKGNNKISSDLKKNVKYSENRDDCKKNTGLLGDLRNFDELARVTGELIINSHDKNLSVDHLFAQYGKMWICPYCETVNGSSVKECVACGKARKNKY